MFLAVFVEGKYPEVDVSKSELDSWISYLKVPFSTLRDPDDAPLRARSVLGRKETSYLIERGTRRILDKTTEAGGGTLAALDEVERL